MPTDYAALAAKARAITAPVPPAPPVQSSDDTPPWEKYAKGDAAPATADVPPWEKYAKTDAPVVVAPPAQVAPAAPAPKPKPQPTATISASKPGFLDSLVAPIREGAIGRALGISTETAEARREDPSNPLLRFEAALPNQKPGVLHGVAQFASGLTTPENLAIMAATSGVGALESALGKTGFSKLISLGFSSQMLWDAVKQAPEFASQVQSGDWNGASETLTKIGLGSAMAVAGVKHAKAVVPTVHTGDNHTVAEVLPREENRLAVVPAQPKVVDIAPERTIVTPPPESARVAEPPESAPTPQRTPAELPPGKPPVDYAALAARARGTSSGPSGVPVVTEPPVIRSIGPGKPATLTTETVAPPPRQIVEEPTTQSIETPTAAAVPLAAPNFSAHEREDGGLFLTAVRDNAEVGSAIIKNLGNGQFELNEIHVNTSARRQGVGSSLYRQAANEVAKIGGKLYTSPELTTSGKELYDAIDRARGLGNNGRVAGAYRREVLPDRTPKAQGSGPGQAELVHEDAAPQTGAPTREGVGAVEPPAPPTVAKDATVAAPRIVTDAGGLAKDMQSIVANAREKQSAFLAEKGMTWEQARALDKPGQDALQSEYTAWLAKHPLDPTPAPQSMASSLPADQQRWASLQAKRGPLTDAEHAEFTSLDAKYGPENTATSVKGDVQPTGFLQDNQQRDSYLNNIVSTGKNTQEIQSTSLVPVAENVNDSGLSLYSHGRGTFYLGTPTKHGVKYYGILKTNPDGTVEHLAVANEYQGKGLGQALLGAARDSGIDVKAPSGPKADISIEGAMALNRFRATPPPPPTSKESLQVAPAPDAPAPVAPAPAPSPTVDPALERRAIEAESNLSNLRKRHSAAEDDIQQEDLAEQIHEAARAVDDAHRAASESNPLLTEQPSGARNLPELPTGKNSRRQQLLDEARETATENAQYYLGEVSRVGDKAELPDPWKYYDEDPQRWNDAASAEYQRVFEEKVRAGRAPTPAPNPSEIPNGSTVPPEWQMTRDEYAAANPDGNYDRMLNRHATLGNIPYEEAGKRARTNSLGAKEIWAKTRAELEQDKKDAVRASRANRADINKMKGGPEFAKWRIKSMSRTAKADIESSQEYGDALLKVHKERVMEALAEGKDVPAEVLADYPDLAPKPPKPTPADLAAKLKADALAKKAARIAANKQRAEEVRGKAAAKKAVVVTPQVLSEKSIPTSDKTPVPDTPQPIAPPPADTPGAITHRERLNALEDKLLAADPASKEYESILGEAEAYRADSKGLTPADYEHANSFIQNGWIRRNDAVSKQRAASMPKPWERPDPEVETPAASTELGKQITRGGKKELTVRGINAEGTGIKAVTVKEGQDGWYVEDTFYKTPPGPENPYGRQEARRIGGNYPKKEAIARAEAWLKGEPNPFAAIEKGQPIAEYKPENKPFKFEPTRFTGDGFNHAPIDGEEVWTDGHVAFKGKVPGPLSTSTQQPNMKLVWDEAAKDAGKPLEPIGFFRRSGVTQVVLSDGVTVNSQFYDWARKQYPGATFKGKSYVSVWSGDKMVGIIMPMRVTPDELPSGIRDAIASPPSSNATRNAARVAEFKAKHPAGTKRGEK